MNTLLTNAIIAADINLGTGSDMVINANNLELPKLISGFLSLILVLAGLVFFFILVIGGIKWILSGGDKAHTEGARNQITAALVGLVIVFSAWAIAKLLQAFFGINILQLDIPQGF